MTEIFDKISNGVKETAKVAMRLALAQKNPADAATFLQNTIDYYSHLYTEEEIEFLQFYFKMQMEMMKNE
jgi:hypothetical protein